MEGVKLQEFLYLLVRDHVPFGVVEGILADLEKGSPSSPSFSEKHVADWAQSCVDRILSGRPL